MRISWRELVTVAILVGSSAAMASSASASDPDPDPGFPVVPCSSAGQKVVLTSNAQLDPSCTYSGGIEVTASDVMLDCRGASVDNEAATGAGIRVHGPVDEDMSGVTVRNCLVSGFTNGIRVTRDGFRALAEGEEYDNALEDVTLADNHISDTRGVGIFVDGYVTGTTIIDSTISGAGSSGVYLEAGSADNVVTRNQIIDNGFGENGPGGQLEMAGDLQFRFWGTGREGISIDGSRRNTVSDNTLEGNSAGGVYLYTNCGEYVNSKPNNYFPRRFGATDNLIAGNRITGGVSGVWVAARMGESMLPMECSDAPYYEDGPTQITLDRAAHNTVSSNVFDDVTYGVRVEDDDTKVIGNTFGGADAGQYAVIVGTPYRTSELNEPVARAQLADNVSTIAGNPSPYRWVDGQTESTFTNNTALGQEAGFCESKPLPRGPFVMTIAFAYEPPGAPVTPTPANLAIPEVGPQAACPGDPDPPPPDTTPPTKEPPAKTPANDFKFGNLNLNKKSGAATLAVKLPGAGKVGLRGTKSVKQSKKTARAAGTIKLTIKAKGRTAKKLKRFGRVKVKATVTFTPAGGTSKTRSRQVKLVKKKFRPAA